MFELWDKVDTFVLGLVLGYAWFPVWSIIKLIVKNAWDATHNCTGDCRQGRLPCNCRGKNET